MLREGDWQRVGDLARLPSVPSGLAKRARIVLLAADGVPNAQIARVVGVSRPTVIGWRDRYAVGGVKGLEDEPRSGPPPEISEADVVVATLAGDGRPLGDALVDGVGLAVDATGVDLEQDGDAGAVATGAGLPAMVCHTSDRNPSHQGLVAAMSRNAVRAS